MPTTTTQTPRRSPPSSHELALITAARGGDEVAFQRLLRRHRDLLTATVSRFYVPGGDHDDVAQEARIGFAKAVDGYRPHRGSFRNFASLCINRHLNSAVKGARRAKHLVLSQAAHGEPAENAMATLPATDGYDDPADRAVAAERRAELRAISARLSPLERQLLGHALLGFNSGEAARHLGMDAKRADNALQRARRRVAAWHERQAA